MRIVLAVFGFLSLAATLFAAAPVTVSSKTVLVDTGLQSPGHSGPEPRFLTEVLYNLVPKGDRLAPSRMDEPKVDDPMADEAETDEAGTEAGRDLAENREPEGPPLPPPDLPVETLCHTLASVAQANGLPAGFFVRLIWQESRFNQRIVSHAGAQGVAQFMPAVAAERGLLNPFDPLSALPHSARFLKEHVQYFGNLGLAAAAYNAGAKRVTDWLARRGPLPNETRQYVKIITGQEPERWTEPSEIDLAVALPKQNPCEGVADLSRNASPEKVAVQLEPPMLRLIEAARIAAAKAAAEAKARSLASLKAKRGRLMAKLGSGKQKAKAVVEKVANRVSGKSARLGGRLPAKIADRVTDKPRGRVRVADAKR